MHAVGVPFDRTDGVGDAAAVGLGAVLARLRVLPTELGRSIRKKHNQPGGQIFGCWVSRRAQWLPPVRPGFLREPSRWAQDGHTKLLCISIFVSLFDTT